MQTDSFGRSIADNRSIVIQDYLQTQEEMEDQQLDDYIPDLRKIHGSGKHLLGLISSVLDLARIEAGRVTYDLVNIPIQPFLAELDALVGPQAAAKQVALDHEEGIADLTVLADREKLRQVLLNLLSNAIRHTPPPPML